MLKKVYKKKNLLKVYKNMTKYILFNSMFIKSLSENLLFPKKSKKNVLFVAKIIEFLEFTFPLVIAVYDKIVLLLSIA